MIYTAMRQWASNTQGQVALIFGFIALPIFLAVGMSLDLSRQVTLKKNLQAAVDAAALAGAKAYARTLSETSAEDTVKAVFDTNRSNMHGDAKCRPHSTSYDKTAYAVTVSATCRVPTAFGAVISGKRNVRVQANSTAAAIHTTADVAMMFDLSDSMSSTEAASLKTAGKRAAELIIGLQSGSRGRVSVVPFAGGVNAGDFGNLATGRSAGNDDENDNNGIPERVCVTARMGTDAATDADPTVANVGSVITQADVFASPGVDMPSVYSCPNSPIHPLDNNLDAVKAAIDGMARGPGIIGKTTAGHLGIAWSWYTISPNWNSVWQNTTYGGDANHGALPYGTPNAIKVAILMTDGTFTTAFAVGLVDGDDDTQYSKISTLSEDLCSGMRDAGIIIYAVAYDATPKAKTLLKNCTGNDSDFYFETSNHAKLEDIYESIASKYLTVGLIE